MPVNCPDPVHSLLGSRGILHTAQQQGEARQELVTLARGQRLAVGNSKFHEECNHQMNKLSLLFWWHLHVRYQPNNHFYKGKMHDIMLIERNEKKKEFISAMKFQMHLIWFDHDENHHRYSIRCIWVQWNSVYKGLHRGCMALDWPGWGKNKTNMSFGLKESSTLSVCPMRNCCLPFDTSTITTTAWQG